MFKPITSLDEIPKKTPEEKAELDILMAEALKSFPTKNIKEETNEIKPIPSKEEMFDIYNDIQSTIHEIKTFLSGKG